MSTHHSFTSQSLSGSGGRLALVLKRQRRLLLSNLFVMSTALSSLLFVAACLL